LVRDSGLKGVTQELMRGDLSSLSETEPKAPEKCRNEKHRLSIK
jgi:hypothetical protein